MRHDSRDRGYKDYWKGKDLNRNPYDRFTYPEEHRKWEQGNHDAYDEHKKETERR